MLLKTKLLISLVAIGLVGTTGTGVYLVSNKSNDRSEYSLETRSVDPQALGGEVAKDVAAQQSLGNLSGAEGTQQEGEVPGVGDSGGDGGEAERNPVGVVGVGGGGDVQEQEGGSGGGAGEGTLDGGGEDRESK